MSETTAKQLISAVSASWADRAPTLLGCPSTLSLLASRDVSGDGMPAALAVAMTWSSAFATACSGASGGVLICLLKNEEATEIDHMIKQASDGLPRPGARSLINSILEDAAVRIEAESGNQISFAPPVFVDLTIDEKRLRAIVGEQAHIGTFSLSVGDSIASQALMVYAPAGSLDQNHASEAKTSVPHAPAQTSEEPVAASQSTASNSQSQAAQRRTNAARRNDVVSPNIERLLGVELDVVVRFGITNVPLRDLVRMGVGTMIELNRAVDEPVELLVNGRPLARGEVVVVDGYYGVRITEIGSQSERAASIA